MITTSPPSALPAQPSGLWHDPAVALEIVIDLAPDGTWVASAAELRLEVRRPTRDEALRAVQVEALRALAERLQRGSIPPYDAFGVVAREGAAVLGVRASAAEAYRALQAAAAASGPITDGEIADEIGRARADAAAAATEPSGSPASPRARR